MTILLFFSDASSSFRRQHSERRELEHSLSLPYESLSSGQTGQTNRHVSNSLQ